jgi:phospholipid/cholesterol/gamma-HCH transport system permease protein
MGFLSYFRFCSKVFHSILFSPPKWKLFLQQMEFVGTKSFLIIVLSGIMIGAVFGLQFGKIFYLFGAESMIGAAASFALSKELAPVIGGFLVAGRCGSAIAAEIATMQVNEQIDAMKMMAVNPISYLAAPRVVGGILMMPLLTGFFIIAGIASAFVMGVLLFHVDEGIFFDKIGWISKPEHLWEGLQKSMIFGAIFSTVGCYQGFFATGGAKGVGKATTQAVVLSLVAILISDFFISYLQMKKDF